jgi:hypothetical protein
MRHAHGHPRHARAMRAPTIARVGAIVALQTCRCAAERLGGETVLPACVAELAQCERRTRRDLARIAALETLQGSTETVAGSTAGNHSHTACTSACAGEAARARVMARRMRARERMRAASVGRTADHRQPGRPKGPSSRTGPSGYDGDGDRGPWRRLLLVAHVLTDLGGRGSSTGGFAAMRART